MKGTVLIAAFSLVLVGCSSNPGAREQSGAVIGAATGALMGVALSKNNRGYRGRGGGGSRGTAIALGAIAGGLVGSSIGRELDAADRKAMSRAQYDAFEYTPSGQGAQWYNPDSGHYGEVVPQPAYERGPGQYCREYTQTVNIGGDQQQAYGTACRQPDGQWEIVSR